MTKCSCARAGVRGAGARVCVEQANSSNVVQGVLPLLAVPGAPSISPVGQNRGVPVWGGGGIILQSVRSTTCVGRW